QIGCLRRRLAGGRCRGSQGGQGRLEPLPSGGGQGTPGGTLKYPKSAGEPAGLVNLNDSNLPLQKPSPFDKISTMESHSARPFAPIVQRLRQAGLRPTRQRLCLARLLFEPGDRHVTAEQLHSEANAARVEVSLATVYNTLHQFTEAGLLRE